MMTLITKLCFIKYVEKGYMGNIDKFCLKKPRVAICGIEMNLQFCGCHVKFGFGNNGALNMT